MLNARSLKPAALGALFATTVACQPSEYDLSQDPYADGANANNGMEGMGFANTPPKGMNIPPSMILSSCAPDLPCMGEDCESITDAQNSTYEKFLDALDLSSKANLAVDYLFDGSLDREITLYVEASIQKQVALLDQNCDPLDEECKRWTSDYYYLAIFPDDPFTNNEIEGVIRCNTTFHVKYPFVEEGADYKGEGRRAVSDYYNSSFGYSNSEETFYADASDMVMGTAHESIDESGTSTPIYPVEIKTRIDVEEPNKWTTEIELPGENTSAFAAHYAITNYFDDISNLVGSITGPLDGSCYGPVNESETTPDFFSANCFVRQYGVVSLKNN